MIGDDGKRLIIAILFFIATSLIATYPLIFHMQGFMDSEALNYTKDYNSDGFLYQRGLEYLKNNTISKLIAYEPVYGDIPFFYYFEGALFILPFNVSGIVAHNLVFILSMVLSGLFMYFLAYRFTKDLFASLFAGFLYCTSNAIINSYLWGHGNLWQFQWIPIIFLFLDKVLIDKNKIRNSILLGLFSGIQVLTCLQYTVYLTLMVPIYVLLRIYFLKRLFTKQTLRIGQYLGYALIVGLIVCGWYIAERTHTPDTTRTVEDNSRADWRMFNIFQLIIPDGHFSIGVVPFLILMIGVYFIFTRNQTELYSFVFLFFISLLLVVGIDPLFTKYSPYYWFFKYWPLVEKFRVPGRMMPFLLFPSALINAVAYTQIFKKFKVKKGLIFFIGMMILIIVGYKMFSPYMIKHVINYSGANFAIGTWNLSAAMP